VIASIVLGAAALALSFVLPQTPDTAVTINGIKTVSHETHPIDVLGTVLRFGGAVALAAGLLAGIAIGRGEMDVPDDVLPPAVATPGEEALDSAPHGFLFW
jgi:hypothetical protein